MTLTGSLLTLGTLSLYNAADMFRMVSGERFKCEALYLADAGLNQGTAQLKLDDTDGFNDNELTVAYPTESVNIGSSYYTLHRWIDTTTVDTGRKFKVWLADNDDTGYAGGPSNDTIDDDNNDEDGGVLLISRGWIEDAQGNVLGSAYVKGLYKLVPYPPEFSVVARGDLVLSGNVSVSGKPSIHTNGNLTSIGGSDETEGAVTAAGTVTGSLNLIGGGTTGSGGAGVVDLPAFSSDYYKSQAASLVWDTTTDLIVDGTCQRAPATGTDCVEICRSGDTYTVSSPSASGGAVCQTPANNKGGVFYFDGNVVVETTDSWNAAILATGRITLTSNTEIAGAAELPGVALVSDQDIVFSGGVEIGSAGNQLGMYAGTGFDFSGGGNKTLYGPLIASDTASITSLSGNISIYYDNAAPPVNGPPIGKLISWTQIE